MFETEGILRFDISNITKKHTSQSKWKKTVIALINDDIFLYYSWFIKKNYGLKLIKPIRGSHFTVISDIVDNEIYEIYKNMFDGKKIYIKYNPLIIESSYKGHWWIKAWSNDADNIRKCMGLGKPYHDQHITIGLSSKLHLDESIYIKRNMEKFGF